MRNFLIIVVLYLSCNCAYPQENIKVGKVHFKKIPQVYLNFTSVGHPLKEKQRAHPYRESDDYIRANVNSFAHKFLKKVAKLIKKKHEPSPLPDTETGFNFTLILKYTGQIKLSNGQMTGLNKIRRGGDVTLTYSTSTKSITLVAPIFFEKLSFTFDYRAKLMGLGPEGGLVATFEGITAQMTMSFDLEEIQASSEFKITSFGNINLRLTRGIKLLDAVINVLSKVVTSTLHRIIQWVLQTVIGETANLAVETLNEKLLEFKYLNSF